MKKLIAVLLALVMVLGLAACGGSSKPAEKPAEPAKEETPAEEPAKEETPAEEPAKEETPAEPAASNTYEVAFVTDVGQLMDKSFNQGTWEGVERYAKEKGLTYNYYQPANGAEATDEDRYDAMKAAADNGAKVIVCAGFMQAGALERAAKEFPEVKFVFIDGWNLGLDNVVGIAFQEEQCGYLAGYAAVMEGYTKLGFCGGGGGTNDAVNRYGYGYVQGAEAAAAEKDVKVDMNYTFLYGAAFQASPELQTLASGWYENGTEVIFSCGGSIFDSITAAASANDAAVIGVDVDQSFSSDTVITSALKGIGEAAYQALTAAYDGTWAEFRGEGAVTLGAAKGAVGLPVDTWSLENWTVAEYEEMFAKIVSGEIAIDNDYTKVASTDHFTLNVVE